MNEKEWMKLHNVPELLRLCLERISVNGDYSAFTGLETDGVATVQVSYDGRQITLRHVNVGNATACEEELENVKNELKKAQQEIKVQKQKNEELESQIQTPSEEVTEKPVAVKTTRKRKTT